MLLPRPAPSPFERFFVYLPAAPETQDRLLLERVAPVLRTLGDDPRLEALSFTRSGSPEPLIRLALRGEPEWLAAQVATKLLSLPNASVFRERDLPDFEQEVRRWGGESGMALAERMFHHDSLACLARIELEAKGIPRSRREWSLLLTEGLLDLLGFDLEERLAFYRRGHAWPIEQGLWTEHDLRLLESKYLVLRDGLAALLGRRKEKDAVFSWGSALAGQIAERCLARLAPLVLEWLAERDAGRLAADFTELTWSLAHVHALRLGIDPIPEAMLRFFACRLAEDGRLEA